MIVERDKVREAVARANQQLNDFHAAVEAAAQALCLPAEAVREVVEQPQGQES